MDTRIGKRVTELREAQLLTRLELAIKADVALSTVLNAEANRSLSFRSIRAIAAALGVEPQLLMTSEKETTTRPSASRRKGGSQAPLPQVA